MTTSIDRFTEALAPYGVKPRAIAASYAMAENVFAVSQTRPGEATRLLVDRKSMEEEGVIRPVAADSEGVITLASNGRPLASTEIEVRDSGGEVLAEGFIGEFHARGAHRFRSYYGRPDLTAQAIDVNGWYATGDLGFILNGEIYVSGRKKDLLILRGRNYLAQDIETAVGAIEGLKTGRIVAFGLPDPVAGTERLIILAEAEFADSSRRGALCLEIRKCVAQAFDTTASDVRIVPDRWLVKSTSGKLARSDNRTKYLLTLND
jgi:acyl-CoA synthetase (AMP-forming)/AMP-acid ligase II